MNTFPSFVCVSGSRMSNAVNLRSLDSRKSCRCRFCLYLSWLCAHVLRLPTSSSTSFAMCGDCSLSAWYPTCVFLLAVQTLVGMARMDNAHLLSFGGSREFLMFEPGFRCVQTGIQIHLFGHVSSSRGNTRLPVCSETNSSIVSTPPSGACWSVGWARHTVSSISSVRSYSVWTVLVSWFTSYFGYMCT